MADPFPEGRSIICGAKVRVDGRIPANRALLLPNHVSWLDICCSAAGPVARSSPRTSSATRFVHWLADQNGTRLCQPRHVKRKGPGGRARQGARGDTAGRGLSRRDGRPGDTLLPVPLDPVRRRSICRQDVGAAGRARLWRRRGGHRLVPGAGACNNIARVLGRKGTLPVTIRLLGPLDARGDRKQWRPPPAPRSRHVLGFSAEPSPIGWADMSPQDLQNQELRLPDERL